MKQISKAIAILAILGLTSATVLAAEGGNPKKGKYLYKKNCKSCHVAGAEGGDLTPMSKTQAQWDRFFDKDKHSAKAGVLEGISDPDLKDIQQFLFDHAADSDQPATCG